MWPVTILNLAPSIRHLTKQHIITIIIIYYRLCTKCQYPLPKLQLPEPSLWCPIRPNDDRRRLQTMQNNYS